MRLVRLALLAVAALLLAACSSAGSAPSWTLGPTAPESSAGPSAAASGGTAPSASAAASAAASPSSAPTGPAASGAAGGGNRIEVKLTDQLKIEPASIDVPVGVPVTFVVTNTGALGHEFFLGDAAAQEEHGKALTGSTTPPPDSANGIGLEPGQTKELTHTFQSAGSSLAGCHVAGHYLAGMKATITIK
jgi:uncharacterized cupredoxin-like copper-binding protein